MKITPEIIAEHGLTDAEYRTILSILGRQPNITELGVFSVMWSEHCSYKNSKPLLQTFPTTGIHILQGPGENAGVVDFDDRFAVVFKMESHNHPSALEPYQGAATGVGGILRDIFTMGARPIALLDPLRFGDPSSARTRHIISGVVEGIADYGNSVGVPTVGGECSFSPAYDGNPLVNVMCVGIIEKDKIMRAVASGAGNLVVYYGNATGRDGIHGATFASTELSEESEEKRSAVQVGDPFMEKKILEATLELISSGAVIALQDMGAAGLTCSTAEMAGRGGMGIRVDLDKVPQRADGLSAYEIMLSESQERMLGICTPERLALVQGILEKWDLDAHVIGELNDSGFMTILHRGEVVAHIPADKISENSPVYQRESCRPGYLSDVPDARNSAPLPDGHVVADLLEFLASPNICSKRWIYEQYDHMVQTQTITAPGDNAALLRIHESGDCLALSADGNGLYCYLDPYMGGTLAVAEAARNVACAGALPLAVTNCLNFGNPMKPEIFFQLAEAVRGIGDACRALNTPVTGGNVSLYNENPSGAIWPTPIIGMVGRLPHSAAPLKGGFPGGGYEVCLLGPPADHLGGTEYLRWKTGTVHGPCPKCDLKLEEATIKVLTALAARCVSASAHDCSTGGLAVTLCECLLWSATSSGARIDLGCKTEADLRLELFAETTPRVVVAVPGSEVALVQRLCAENGVLCRNIGKTDQSGFLRFVCGDFSNDITLDDIRQAYESKASIFPANATETALH